MKVKQIALDEKAVRKLALLHRNPQLLSVPQSLRLTQIRWCDCELNSMELTIEQSGRVSFRGDAPSTNVICDDLKDWSEDCFQARTDFGPIQLHKGGCLMSRWTWGREAGRKITVHLQSWNWSSFDAAGDNWWVAPISFQGDKAPLHWWFLPRGNVSLSIDEDCPPIWRFQLGSEGKQAFFGSFDDQWYLLIETQIGSPPGTQKVSDLLTAVSFALGVSLEVGVFSQLGNDNGVTGMARLSVYGSHRSKRSQPAALPIEAEPEWLIRFVERSLIFMEHHPWGILHVAMNSYLHSLDSTLDSEFVQNWIGTEAIAGWLLKTGKIPRQEKSLLVKDPDRWKNWVQNHRKEICELAKDASSTQKLYDKVLSAADKRESKVEKVFRGLDLPWTAEMEDVQDIRHLAAHEGIIAENEGRNYTRDRERIGHIKTMLTALIAKIIGYDGPIADRSKTSFNIGIDKRPDWWPTSELDNITEYTGNAVSNRAPPQPD